MPSTQYYPILENIGQYPIPQCQYRSNPIVFYYALCLLLSHICSCTCFLVAFLTCYPFIRLASYKCVINSVFGVTYLLLSQDVLLWRSHLHILATGLTWVQIILQTWKCVPSKSGFPRLLENPGFFSLKFQDLESPGKSLVLESCGNWNLRSLNILENCAFFYWFCSNLHIIWHFCSEFWGLKLHQTSNFPGFCPGPHGTAYSVPPDPVAGGEGTGWARCPSPRTLPPLSALRASGFFFLYIEAFLRSKKVM